MAGFFDRIFGRNKAISSAHKAKERLQFVLVHDRIDLPPEHLVAMKDEILAVISKYVDVNTDNVDIALEQIDRNSNLLRAEIPFAKNSPIFNITDDIDDNEEEQGTNQVDKIDPTQPL